MATTHLPSIASAQICVDGVSFSFADHRVLTDVSLTVSGGERVGLIGENGSGKSTLLRVIAGLLEPDAGNIHVYMPGVSLPRVGLLHQEPPFSLSATVKEVIETAVAPVRRAAVALDHAAEAMSEATESQAAAAAYTSALETAEHLEVWDLSARIERILDGLGLASVPRDRIAKHLSGGQCARLSLAWLLLSQPDVLLLDEPTNHLDDTATEYLQTYLLEWRGPVLMSSHDRAFLDETATSLIDMDPTPIPAALKAQLSDGGAGTGAGLTRYTGAYTDYLANRLNTRMRWDRQYRDEQAELKRLRVYMRENSVVGHVGRKPRSEARSAKKFYSDRNAKVVARRVNSFQSRLEELEKRQIRKPPSRLTFSGLDAVTPSHSPIARNHESLVIATDIGLDARLGPVSLTIGARDKWLITGCNGSGKSTLPNILAGRLTPSSGSIRRIRGVRTVLLTQEVLIPDPVNRGSERTVQEAYRDIVGRRQAKQAPLSMFGLLAPKDEGRRVEALSVGQQRRLALATILADPPDLLLLDEPTNHLSLTLVTEIEASIVDYPGAVVIASHDRWLRRKWKGRRLNMTPPSNRAVDACR